MALRNDHNDYDRLWAKFEKMNGEGRRQIVAKLLHEKNFFEDILDSLHEGLLVVNTSLNIRAVNQAARAMLGLPENVLGERIDKFFKHIDWESLRHTPPEDWGHLSRQELEVFYPEHRFFNLYLIPVSERPDMRRGELPLATLILHDVTDMTRATEKNVETQRVKAITQLAAGVAHELGNPLNAIGIHLQILKRKLKKSDDSTLRKDITQFVDILEQETRRLDSIVKNFLNAVRPGHLELTPIEPRKIICDALQFLQPELESHDIQVKVSFPDLLPIITGDAGQLTQAIFNIVKNALQAMHNGGNLSISCEVDDIFVHIKFTDTGPGMTQEQLSRITEPYFTTKPGGTGLGLLIVDRIIRAHGGELSLDSIPGKGTSITISLPRYARMVRQLPCSGDQIQNGDSPNCEIINQENYHA